VDNTATRTAVAQVSFVAADGSRWTVREYTGQGAGLNGDGACLIFECDNAVRRVKTFPKNWGELGSDDLVTLSWLV
jgi:hypothetical protein